MKHANYFVLFIALFLSSCSPALSSTPVPNPSLTSSPIPTPTFSPPSSPSPTSIPLNINLKQVREILGTQSSFRWTVTISKSGEDIHQIEVIRVRIPDSYLYKIYREGSVAVQWIIIENNEWFGIGSNPDIWYEKDEVPQNLMENSTDLFNSAENVALSSLIESFREKEINLSKQLVFIGEQRCAEYKWSDEESEGFVYLSSDDGLPVKIEVNLKETSTMVTVDHINDPTNIILPPQ